MLILNYSISLLILEQFGVLTHRVDLTSCRTVLYRHHRPVRSQLCCVCVLTQELDPAQFTR